MISTLLLLVVMTLVGQNLVMGFGFGVSSRAYVNRNSIDWPRATTSMLGKAEKAHTELIELSTLLEEAKSCREEALMCLQTSEDTKEVENFRVLYLGKNGKITGLMKQMKALSKDDKPRLGEVVNEAKGVVEEAIEV